MSKKLVKSTALVASMTLVSRVFGFARDLLWAQLFGTVAGFDVFVVAFKIPNFMRSLFAEGSFSQAFVPVLSEYRETKEEAAAQEFISTMGGDWALLLSIITVLGVVLAPVLVALFAPGFLYDPYRFTLAQTMLRITFPYLFFISLTAFCSSVLNTYGYFGVPAFTPVLLNITLITATVLWMPYFSGSAMVLPWAVVVAGILQLLLQLLFLYRTGKWHRWRINFNNPEIKRVFKRMFGALLGLSVNQISLFLDTLFASFLQVGSISWIYFSGRLMNFPLGIISVAVVTVVMPQLSRSHSAQSKQGFSETLLWALHTTFVMGLPAAVGLFILAQPLLAALFGYGKFTPTDITMTALSLKAFAIGLPAFMLIRVLNASLYARQNIRTPVKVSIITLLINMVLNCVLIRPFAHIGLVMATSLASWTGVGLLIYYLSQTLNQQGEGPIFNRQGGYFVLKVLFSATMMSGWLLWVCAHIGYDWTIWAWKQRLLYILFLILVGQVIYFGSLGLLGIRFRDFVKT